MRIVAPRLQEEAIVLSHSSEAIVSPITPALVISLVTRKVEENLVHLTAKQWERIGKKERKEGERDIQSGMRWQKRVKLLLSCC